MVPIFILALILFVACVQGNIATNLILEGTIEGANKYEQSITDLETLFSDENALQDVEEIKRLYAEMNEQNRAEMADIIVKYINGTIMQDYDGFVDSGKQYNQDAAYVNGIISQFYEMSDKLQQLIDDIAKTVDSIAGAMEGNAVRIAEATTSVNDLSKDIDAIALEMDDNQEVATAVQGEKERFIRL